MKTTGKITVNRVEACGGNCCRVFPGRLPNLFFFSIADFLRRTPLEINGRFLTAKTEEIGRRII